MRRSFVLPVVLLFGCSGSTAPLSLVSAVPGVGSAAGGEEVTLGGAGFVSGTLVSIDGVDVPTTRLDAERLVIFTPPGIAGPVDVTVTRPDGATVTSGDLYEYLPLDPWFVDALVGAVPVGGTGLYVDAAGGDFDGDLDEDLVLGGEFGLWPWENRDLGRFDGAQTLDAVVSAVEAMDFDGDGIADLFACGAGGTLDRFFVGQQGGLRELGALLPVGQACLHVVPGDLDADGRSDLVLLGEDVDGEGQPRSFIRVLRNSSDASGVSFRIHDGLEAATALSSPPGTPLSGGAATDAAVDVVEGLLQGAGAGEITATLGEDGGMAGLRVEGPWFVTPDSLSFLVDGAADLQLSVRLEDGNGEVFAWVVGGEGEARSTPPLVEAVASGDGVFDLPVEAIELLGSSSGAGELAWFVDQVVLHASEGSVLVEDFEERTFGLQSTPPDAAFAVGDVDADGDLDLVLGGPSGVRVALQTPGAGDASWGMAGFVLTPLEGIDVDDPIRSLEVVPRETGVDLLVTTSGVHRWLRLSGEGVEDRTTELPDVPSVVTGTRSADLDRDGLPELLVLQDGVREGVLHSTSGGVEDWTVRLPVNEARTLDAVVLDVNRDGADDVFLLNEDAPHRLLLSVEAGEQAP